MILLFDRKLFAIEIASSLLIDGELTGTSTFDNLKVLNTPITNIRAIPIIFGLRTLEAVETVLNTSFCSEVFLCYYRPFLGTYNFMFIQGLLYWCVPD